MSDEYMFDIFVVNITTPNTEFADRALLSVDVLFNNEHLSITSSRIDVLEFKAERSFEFAANPKELSGQMQAQPLQLLLKYDGEEFGTAQLNWPSSVYEKVHTCAELTHFEECDIQSGEQKVGSIQVKIRIQNKCKEWDQDETENQGVDINKEIRSHFDKLIDPHDVFFLLGGQAEADAKCQNTLEEGELCESPTMLDLSKYRHLNGKHVKTPEIINNCLMCCDYKALDKGFGGCCCKSKKSNDYEQFSGMCSSAGTSKSEKSTCNKKHPKQSRKFSEKGSSRDRTLECCCCCADTRRLGTVRGSAFVNGKIRNICPNPILCSKTTIERPKYCPICKANISWLPKLAACPKCCYKPVPYFSEKPYNEKLTAEQIIHEYNQDTANSTSQNPDEEQKKISRCTCKNGKICAHCKIKQFCREMFQSKSPKGCRKPNERPSDDNSVVRKCSRTDPYKICRSSSDSRAYLARVFSQMRDLYNIKPNKTKRSFPITGGSCEKSLQKFSECLKRKLRKPSVSADMRQPSKSRPRLTIGKDEVKRKDFLAKNFNAEAKAKLCRGKKFNFKTNRVYPGVVFGHNTCVRESGTNRKSVPQNMGWLWNVDTNAIRRGWRPGAIRKPIKEIMKFFLKDYPADTLNVSRYSCRKRVDHKECDPLVQHPTLHIRKKNGQYFITMRPLKDATLLKECADPYLKMKPIQFRITKNPLLSEISDLKRALKKLGFVKCTCHKPVSECYCRNYLDKKRLEFELKKACRCRCIPNVKDQLVLSDTTDSEAEFDFGVTPPAGVIKPYLKNKPNLVNHETQYDSDDWSCKPVFPKPPNKYMKPPYGYNLCAIGGGDSKIPPRCPREKPYICPHIAKLHPPETSKHCCDKAASKSHGRPNRAMNLNKTQMPLMPQSGSKRPGTVVGFGIAPEKGRKPGSESIKINLPFRPQRPVAGVGTEPEKGRKPGLESGKLIKSNPIKIYAGRPVKQKFRDVAPDKNKKDFITQNMGLMPKPLLHMIDRRRKPDPCNTCYVSPAWCSAGAALDGCCLPQCCCPPRPNFPLC